MALKEAGRTMSPVLHVESSACYKMAHKGSSSLRIPSVVLHGCLATREPKDALKLVTDRIGLYPACHSKAHQYNCPQGLQQACWFTCDDSNAAQQCWTECMCTHLTVHV